MFLVSCEDSELLCPGVILLIVIFVSQLLSYLEQERLVEAAEKNRRQALKKEKGFEKV